MDGGLLAHLLEACGGDEASVAKKDAAGASSDLPLKKRRLISGKEMVFKKPGEEEDFTEDEEEGPQPIEDHSTAPTEVPIPIDDRPRITIHEDD